EPERSAGAPLLRPCAAYADAVPHFYRTGARPTASHRGAGPSLAPGPLPHVPGRRPSLCLNRDSPRTPTEQNQWLTAPARIGYTRGVQESTPQQRAAPGWRRGQTL